MRTLLYEAANVMLTRYKGQLKLKDWAFAIAKRSTMRKARVALARRLGIIMHAMLRDGTQLNRPSPRNRQDRRPNLAPKRSDAQGGSRRRRGLRSTRPTAGRRRFQPSRPAPSLPHQVPNEHAENTGTRKRRYPEEPPPFELIGERNTSTPAVFHRGGAARGARRLVTAFALASSPPRRLGRLQRGHRRVSLRTVPRAPTIA